MKNTSMSLGNYFDQFNRSQISVGRYKNVSEVIRALNPKNREILS